MPDVMGGAGGRCEESVVGWSLRALMQQFGDWLLLPIQEGGRPEGFLEFWNWGGVALTEGGLQV